jgi:hypothetical protein
LHVALGSDKTVFELKGRLPVNSEQERLFMVKSVSYVKQAFISSGSGILDFGSELREIMPDYFVVNADGHIVEKRDLCHELRIEYIILERKPHPGFDPRSTTEWKLSGAGGGGYLILVCEKPVPGSIRVIARRETD